MTKKEIMSQVYDINSYYASKGYTKKYSKSWFSSKYDQNMLFVAFNKDITKVLGFACVANINILNYISLVLLCVHNDNIRKGIGTELINQIRKRFKGKNIVLNVRKFNFIGLDFYKEYGFEKLKEYKDTVLLIKK